MEFINFNPRATGNAFGKVRANQLIFKEKIENLLEWRDEVKKEVNALKKEAKELKAEIDALSKNKKEVK